jgi:hypothetical protein
MQCLDERRTIETNLPEHALHLGAGYRKAEQHVFGLDC